MIEVQDLKRVLESAVVVSWADLMPGVPKALINIEYDFAPDGSLDRLEIWTSRERGYWFLACSYWMSVSERHSAGVRFDNGFRSEALADNLTVLMDNQNVFYRAENLGRRGLLQITNPTEEENSTANASMREALRRVNSGLVAPVHPN